MRATGGPPAEAAHRGSVLGTGPALHARAIPTRATTLSGRGVRHPQITRRQHEFVADRAEGVTPGRDTVTHLLPGSVNRPTRGRGRGLCALGRLTDACWQAS